MIACEDDQTVDRGSIALLFPGFPAFGGRAQKHSEPTQNQILEIA